MHKKTIVLSIALFAIQTINASENEEPNPPPKQAFSQMTREEKTAALQKLSNQLYPPIRKQTGTNQHSTVYRFYMSSTETEPVETTCLVPKPQPKKSYLSKIFCCCRPRKSGSPFETN